MRRNCIFGSASLRPSLQWQGSNHKNIICHSLASLPKQVLRDILDNFDVCNDSDELFDFLKNTWTVWKEQMAVLFWIASPSHGNAGPQAQCSHGKAQTISPSRSITWQWPFLGNVFDSSSAIHERDSRSWRPWNGRSHGEGCGHSMGRSGQPRSYGRSRLDTAKQEPRSQQREERRQKGQ